MESQQHQRRLKRFDDSLHARYLTFSCFRRQPFLVSERARLWMCDPLTRACETHKFILGAWVLMPEHVHLLVVPRAAGQQVGPLLASMKQSVARKAVWWAKKHSPEFLASMEDESPAGRVVHRFWQRGGGFDRNLYERDSIQRAVQYIHENPVRRKLVVRAEDWEWSSAREYASRGTGVIRVDLESLNKLL